MVVDASALVYAGTEIDRQATDLRSRMANEDCHAPYLIDAELGNVLRRKVRRGELTAQRAEVILWAAPQLIDYRYEARGGLAQQAWRLRDNVTFYDALYASLAASLGVALLTTDSRLSRAPGLPCDVDLVTAWDGV